MKRKKVATPPPADVTIRLGDLDRLKFLTRLAVAMIERDGFYTFTETSTGEKVKVIK